MSMRAAGMGAATPLQPSPGAPRQPSSCDRFSCARGVEFYSAEHSASHRVFLTLRLKSIYPQIFLPKISIIFSNVFTCSLSPILLLCCSDTPLWPFKCFFSQSIFQLVNASSRHRVSPQCSLTGSTRFAAWGVSGFPSPLALLLLAQLLGLLLPTMEKASRLDPSEVPASTPAPHTLVALGWQKATSL